MAFTEHHKSLDALDDSAQEFVLWAFEALGLHAKVVDGGVYVLEILEPLSNLPNAIEHPYAPLAGRQFQFSAEQACDFGTGSNVEPLTWQSPLMRWLLDELQGGDRPVHATAAHQPISVHELAEHLFAQFKVDGGHVHLGGCRLGDRPFLRLTYRHTRAADGASQLVHCFGTGDGELIDPTLREDLRLAELAAWPGRTPRIEASIVERWANLTRQQFHALQGDEGMQLIATTLVWCKYAEGKLTFSIGQKSVEVSFSGWGRLLVTRRVLPPQYQCPLSGRMSYHLAATDDGRITVAEAIATCSESSRRVLESELRMCAVSGRLALPEYLQACPITGEAILASLLVKCAMCQQRVSPRVLAGGKCPACRQLAPVSKADPGLARILDTYPRLDRWRTWKMAESRAAQVLVGSSAWKRLLVVLDKQTLEVLHMAAGSRLTSKWIAATERQRAEWIG